MTTYNGSKFIVEQLDSLKDQTLPADEVLIFDDRSTDETPYIVQTYIKENGLENWVFQVNEKNLGFKENFYQAIKSASGDIVFLCDQDDVWHHDKIEMMVRYFEQTPDMKILNTGFRKIDANGKPICERAKWFSVNNGLVKGRMKPKGLKTINVKRIVRNNISPGCTSAFGRECKQYYLENASKLAPHDWELNLFGAFMRGLYFYNEVLTDYRIHENNAIGFADEAKNFNLKLRLSKNQERRMNFIRDEYQRTKAYSRDGLLEKLSRRDAKALKRYAWFIEKRLQALTENKLKYWFCSLLFIADYLRMVGFRGLVGDFLLIVTKHGEREISL
jgi:glycosyltransferase involved in cell wall biosynthesis